jgi:hypothetical protein
MLQPIGTSARGSNRKAELSLSPGVTEHPRCRRPWLEQPGGSGRRLRGAGSVIGTTGQSLPGSLLLAAPPPPLMPSPARAQIEGRGLCRGGAGGGTSTEAPPSQSLGEWPNYGLWAGPP